ncbi:MAG: hypothetical protein A3A98_04000 [Candidatus Staskawiczbacteria bacterium RIFCSPLOWO2_01_FULL_40_39]|uniref:Glycerophosphoryl diester phosphodiesterase membrane domain-containing protein n=1 Tax=Candidatus Staskawiczbacteria bacterium RIFCSPHIGHO2_01_FULL_39_25 TaxID=1802202 RepID=A0A1G2HNV5_9BACT|nr:MAG: hypothetical protein A2730_03215 [Candidatus Staskawiczbacteria bacterium RIFCSPHIGHO2_01_FULL_39_25]OGZ73932.1 MAG: hypothetical protein A3A98_04000 [Candidatus Staskawiczbacteria bacterium RIFCSPLOWO2_01_FULL_40_39]OGZ76533.1 MAG: hypothetical protein A3I87_00245 [Candidatus Staskawiczbacteria bacterium RIFCSPLOWO2_02_FULL_39_8]
MENKALLLPVGDLFKKSFQIYKEKYRAFIGISSINLPLFLLFPLFSFLDYHFREPIVSNLALLIIAIIVMIIAGLTGAIIKLWSFASTIFFIRERNANDNIRYFLALGWSKLNAYLWVYLLMSVISVIGFILFIIPGIIFSVWYSLSLYIFANENVRGMEALKRSKELVAGNWWAVFNRFLALGIILLIIAVVTGWAPLIGSLVNLFFIMPFSLIYGYLLYEDLKRVKT